MSSVTPSPTVSPLAPDLSDRVVLGVVLMIGFCLFAPLLDVASKLAARTIPVAEITTARFVVQAALMVPICAVLGYDLRLRRALWGKVSLRAVFLIISTFCFIAAIRVMPIADALAIVFVEPFILLLLGKVIYGEDVGPRRLGACVVGFVGALMVIRPSLAAFGPVALLPLGTAVFFAFYMLITRSLSRKLHPVPMQLHTAVAATVFCLPLLMLGDWVALPGFAVVRPEGWAWLWLFGVGAAAALSHLMMSFALRFAPSATLAPLHYLEIVTAVWLGYAVFGDLPNAMTFAGIAVIVASGLYIVFRERQIASRD